MTKDSFKPFNIQHWLSLFIIYTRDRPTIRTSVDRRGGGGGKYCLLRRSIYYDHRQKVFETRWRFNICRPQPQSAQNVYYFTAVATAFSKKWAWLHKLDGLNESFVRNAVIRYRYRRLCRLIVLGLLVIIRLSFYPVCDIRHRGQRKWTRHRFCILVA